MLPHNRKMSTLTGDKFGVSIDTLFNKFYADAVEGFHDSVDEILHQFDEEMKEFLPKPFLQVPGELVEYLSSFLRLNDAVNFRRTCKRNAELAKSTVDKKIEMHFIYLWLAPCVVQTKGSHLRKTISKTKSGAMDAGLDLAFNRIDLEAAEFFWERGADLSYHAYINAIATPKRLGKFVEYPLDRGYQGSLDMIMHAALFMTDVLLIRRCISLGARDFNIEKYTKMDKNFKKARKCSKCGSPGHNKNTCK